MIMFQENDLREEGRRSPEQFLHLLSSANHFRRDPRNDVCGWMGHSITKERLLKTRVCWVQGKGHLEVGTLHKHKHTSMTSGMSEIWEE